MRATIDIDLSDSGTVPSPHDIETITGKSLEKFRHIESGGFRWLEFTLEDVESAGAAADAVEEVFSRAEADYVRMTVRAGGSTLLIQPVNRVERGAGQ